MYSTLSRNFKPTPKTQKEALNSPWDQCHSRTLEEPDKALKGTLKNPLNESLKEPLMDPVREPLKEPLRDPLKEPLKDPYELP